MSDLVWQDPPRDQRKNRALAEAARALKERPGEWAIVTTTRSRSTAANISRGRAPEFLPVSDWEVTTRSRGDGMFDTYVRFVGAVKS